MSHVDTVVSRSEAPEGIGLWLATVVSYVVSPLVLPPIVYGAVLAHIGAPQADVLWGAGIGFVFLALIPLAYVGWMRIQGRIESLEIRDRSKRTEPFLVVLAAAGGAFVTVLGAEVAGRRLLAVLIGCHLMNTSLLFLITAWWKISVHCASIAGAVATLAFIQGHVSGTVLNAPGAELGLLGGGGLLMGLMLWARIRSRAHTPGQAVAGTVLGLAPYGELFLLAGWIGV